MLELRRSYLKQRGKLTWILNHFEEVYIIVIYVVISWVLRLHVLELMLVGSNYWRLRDASERQKNSSKTTRDTMWSPLLLLSLVLSQGFWTRSKKSFRSQVAKKRRLKASLETRIPRAIKAQYLRKNSNVSISFKQGKKPLTQCPASLQKEFSLSLHTIYKV